MAPGSASTLFDFPNPVNEIAARTVAAGVATLTLVTIVLGTVVAHGWLWLTTVLVYGFLARVLTGPTLSPLGQLATRAVAPRLAAPRPVPGPPKRFAQGMGLVMSTLALALLGAGLWLGAVVALALILCAATLESAFGFCIGCRIFALLMRAGVIPQETCVACADLGRRTLAA